MRGVTELLHFSIRQGIQGDLEALACIRISKRPSFLEHHIRSGDFSLKFVHLFIHNIFFLNVC